MYERSNFQWKRAFQFCHEATWKANWAFLNLTIKNSIINFKLIIKTNMLNNKASILSNYFSWDCTFFEEREYCSLWLSQWMDIILELSLFNFEGNFFMQNYYTCPISSKSAETLNSTTFFHFHCIMLNTYLPTLLDFPGDYWILTISPGLLDFAWNLMDFSNSKKFPPFRDFFDKNP